MESVINTSSVISIRNEESGTELTKLINTSVSSSMEPVPDHVVVDITNNVPSRHLLDDNEEARLKYLSMGVALYNAALSANWEAAKRVIDQDRTLLTGSISTSGLNVLHLAAGIDNTRFIRLLVAEMSKDDLELRDKKGNTALCYTAATGTVQIAEILVEHNPSLATIRGGHGMTPLYMAAVFGKREMAWFLYHKMGEKCTENDRKGIFFSCIYTGIYDLAYKLVNDDAKLATARDKDNKTALHLLAETPEAFVNKSSERWSKLFKPCWKFNKLRKLKENQALELVKFLWAKVLIQGHEETISIIRTPEMLFDAAKVGNFEFLFELIKSYPDLGWERDAENRTIVHYAVMYRHANIFNIIHNMGPIKEVITTYEDSKKNHLLHLVAKLPPSDRLNTVSGPALQMQRELLWFQEVKRIMQPSYIKKENLKKQVAEQLFSTKHKSLQEEGEKFLKNTANSAMIVSTLITTVVFAAPFTLPGGNSDKGVPYDIKAASYAFFILSDSVALISSVVSITMFLSILTSRYAESDFKKLLPLKLMIGLASLFFSLITMVIAFTSAIFIACNYGFKWVPFLVSVLAFIPLIFFVVLQFPLFIDTFSSTYRSRTVQFQSSM